jgi:hypothetical protein
MLFHTLPLHLRRHLTFHPRLRQRARNVPLRARLLSNLFPQLRPALHIVPHQHPATVFGLAPFHITYLASEELLNRQPNERTSISTFSVQ